MFKTFLKAAAVLFISFAGISCEKDSDSALSSDSVQPGTMQVSVDGNQYSFSSSQLSSGRRLSVGVCGRGKRRDDGGVPNERVGQRDI
jgi:hypothetical protein